MELIELLEDKELLDSALRNLEKTHFLPVKIDVTFDNGSEMKSKLNLNLYEILYPYLKKIQELQDIINETK